MTFPLVATLPAPKPMIAKLAPKVAALEIPIVEGEAKGFLKHDCITAPAKANPAPQMIAPIALGILNSQTVIVETSSPNPKRAFIVSTKLRFEDPSDIPKIKKLKRRTNKIIRMIILFFIFFL